MATVSEHNQATQGVERIGYLVKDWEKDAEQLKQFEQKSHRKRKQGRNKNDFGELK